MLNSLVPVFTIVIAAVFFSFIWKTKHFIGILTGIIGTCLIVFQNNFTAFSSVSTAPILMVLGGSLCYAISLNIIKFKLQHLHPSLITSASFLFIGIPSFILGLIYPKILLWPYKKWMQFGNFLGWINSGIILGLVFVLGI